MYRIEHNEWLEFTMAILLSGCRFIDGRGFICWHGFTGGRGSICGIGQVSYVNLHHLTGKGCLCNHEINQGTHQGIKELIKGSRNSSRDQGEYWRTYCLDAKELQRRSDTVELY